MFENSYQKECEVYESIKHIECGLKDLGRVKMGL